MRTSPIRPGRIRWCRGRPRWWSTRTGDPAAPSQRQPALADPGRGDGDGASIAETVVREVEEETGLKVEPTRVIGIYSNPRHVIEYADGEVRQQFSICFACDVTGGRVLDRTDESLEVGFFTPDQIEALPMHPSIRLRITHYLEGRNEPVIA